jgi:hypothetical protein
MFRVSYGTAGLAAARNLPEAGHGTALRPGGDRRVAAGPVLTNGATVVTLATPRAQATAATPFPGPARNVIVSSARRGNRLVRAASPGPVNKPDFVLYWPAPHRAYVNIRPFRRAVIAGPAISGAHHLPGDSGE